MSGDGALTWRPIEPGDAGAWAVLVAAIQAGDRGWDYFTEQDLLEDFGDPDCDFARGSMAVYDGSTMVGYGILISQTAADPVHEMRYQGGVHPSYQGGGSAVGCWTGPRWLPLPRVRRVQRGRRGA